MDATGSTRLAPQPAWDRDRDFLPASPGAPPAEGGPSFRDMLSSLNPLQHIPVIGAIYRHVTGDKAHPAAQVVGGLVFGGPIGMMLAALGATIEQATGKSPLELALEAVRGPSDTIAVAAAPDPAGPAATATEDPGQSPAQPATAQPTTAEPARPTVPAAGGAAAQAPAQPAEAVPPPTRPAVAGARDLSFYQAHAGARLPPAATTSSPVGNAAARLASLAPPSAAATEAVAIPPAPPPLPPAFQPTALARPATRVEPAAVAAPARDQDFASRMLHGLDRYRSMRVGGDSRAAVLDRTE